MAPARTATRNFGAVAVVLLGALVGSALYVLAFFILAIIGFWSYSFGTAPFVALAIATITVVAFGYSGRRSPGPSERRHQSRLFVGGLLGLLVAACVGALIVMPEYVIFLPR